MDCLYSYTCILALFLCAVDFCRHMNGILDTENWAFHKLLPQWRFSKTQFLHLDTNKVSIKGVHLWDASLAQWVSRYATWPQFVPSISLSTFFTTNVPLKNSLQKKGFYFLFSCQNVLLYVDWTGQRFFKVRVILPPVALTCSWQHLRWFFCFTILLLLWYESEYFIDPRENYVM